MIEKTFLEDPMKQQLSLKFTELFLTGRAAPTLQLLLILAMLALPLISSQAVLGPIPGGVGS